MSQTSDEMEVPRSSRKGKIPIPAVDQCKISKNRLRPCYMPPPVHRSVSPVNLPGQMEKHRHIASWLAGTSLTTEENFKDDCIPVQHVQVECDSASVNLSVGLTELVVEAEAERMKAIQELEATEKVEREKKRYREMKRNNTKKRCKGQTLSCNDETDEEIEVLPVASLADLDYMYGFNTNANHSGNVKSHSESFSVARFHSANSQKDEHSEVEFSGVVNVEDMDSIFGPPIKKENKTHSFQNEVNKNPKKNQKVVGDDDMGVVTVEDLNEINGFAPPVKQENRLHKAMKNDRKVGYEHGSRANGFKRSEFSAQFAASNRFNNTAENKKLESSDEEFTGVVTIEDMDEIFGSETQMNQQKSMNSLQKEINPRKANHSRNVKTRSERLIVDGFHCAKYQEDEHFKVGYKSEKRSNASNSSQQFPSPCITATNRKVVSGDESSDDEFMGVLTVEELDEINGFAPRVKKENRLQKLNNNRKVGYEQDKRANGLKRSEFSTQFLDSNRFNYTAENQKFGSSESDEEFTGVVTIEDMDEIFGTATQMNQQKSMNCLPKEMNNHGKKNKKDYKADSSEEEFAGIANIQDLDEIFPVQSQRNENANGLKMNTNSKRDIFHGTKSEIAVDGFHSKERESNKEIENCKKMEEDESSDDDLPVISIDELDKLNGFF